MRAGILLIDDDPNVTYSIKTVLRIEGYKVYTAIDIDQAKIVITENDVYLVIMDIVPDRDGSQPVEELQRLDEKLKIILLSGYSNVFEVVEGLGLEVYRVFLKPVDCGLLLSTIRSIDKEEIDPHRFVDAHQKM